MSTSLVPVVNGEIIDPNQTYAHGHTKGGSSISPYILMGFLFLLTFIGGSGYWAMTARLDGAVVAPASFVVEGNRKTVQHLEGGIVKDLLVREGDFVTADQVLMRLDSTQNDVNVDVLGNQLAELYIRQARLLAELREADDFTQSDIENSITRAIDPAKRSALFNVQKNLFDAQSRARTGEEEILMQRIKSLREEIGGLDEQRAANERQLVIARSEQASFEALLKKELTTSSRVNNIRREVERLLGSDAQFVTSQARAKNQIGELELQRLSRKKLRIEAITTELALIETQISGVEPQYFGAQAQQKRIAVKAPVTGKVVNVKVYTQGGVVRPGQDILDIVPADEELVIEARVNTDDIEKLRIGQPTRVRLTAFDQNQVPEANGLIIGISADSLTDERTGKPYYVAKVRLDKEQPLQVQQLAFVPGMPADIFVKTGERTAISYLLQPLNDRLSRTFIE